MLPLPRTWKTYVGEPTFNCASAKVPWTYECPETFEGGPPGWQVEILLKPEGGRPLPCHQLFSISWPLKFFPSSSQGPSKEPEGSSQKANQITSFKTIQNLPLLWDKDQYPSYGLGLHNVGCHLSRQPFWPHLEYFPPPPTPDPSLILSHSSWPLRVPGNNVAIGYVHTLPLCLKSSTHCPCHKTSAYESPPWKTSDIPTIWARFPFNRLSQSHVPPYGTLISAYRYPLGRIIL